MGATTEPPSEGIDDLGATAMSESDTETDPTNDELPWQQRWLDNYWILLAIGVVVPGILYLGWGLWELAELPTWGGQ